MPSKYEFTIRLNAAQYRLLQKLSVKLGIKNVDILRFALARLAEAEGVITSEQPSGSGRREGS